MKLSTLTDSFAGRVARKFSEDQSPNWAVLIAWNALFAMFPMLLAMAALLGFALGFAGFSSKVFYNGILTAVPDSARGTVLDALSGVQHQKGLLSIVGLAGLLWGGSALFGAMEQAFAVIYHTKPRAFIAQKMLGFGMIFAFTILAGIAVATSSLLPALKRIPNIPTLLTHGVVAFVLQMVIGVLAGFVLFALIYFVVPNRRQEWGQVWPGAVVAGVLFELISLLFPLYLQINKGINQYGKTFGLFFLLLTFFFFIGLITMLGVEVNSLLFPVPIEQPSGRGEPGRAAASAPPQSGPEGEGHAWSPKPAPGANGTSEAKEPAMAPLPNRVPALLIFLGSAVAGLLVGRRAGENNW